MMKQGAVADFKATAPYYILETLAIQHVLRQGYRKLLAITKSHAFSDKILFS